jgi:NADH:ubiquinone oxidoreductase subunit 5 (subunit L)/multisubunit Na+/H+ antiporter MnhA subunit
MKAIIINRVGDFGFYFALIILFFIFKTFDFFNIFSLCSYVQNYLFLNLQIKSDIVFEIKWLDILAFSLFLGAVGKSAQLGLHT